MTTNRLLLVAAALLTTLGVLADRRTTMATLYRQFKPAVITLTDGRRVSQPLANVFLKNSALLYMKGEYTMEANMDNVAAVDFDDRSFVAINRQLATFIDSVGANRLYCVELFDKEAYERNLRNNVNITNLDFGNEQMATTTVDLNNEDDYRLPVVPHFYYWYQGAYVKVHERTLLGLIPKDKRRLFRSVVGGDSFSWTDPASLLSLLKAISD